MPTEDGPDMAKPMTAIPYENVIWGNAKDDDRERVRMLRLAGENCTDIAEQIGLTEEQTLEYCRQLGFPAKGSCRLLEPEADEAEWLRHREGLPPRRKCPVCGGLLIQPERGRRRKFCSDQCKKQWWNDKWRQEGRFNGRLAVCEYCGKRFVAVKERHDERRFCSRECYFASRYGRRE